MPRKSSKRGIPARAVLAGGMHATHYPHDRVANAEWERKAELLAAHPSIKRHGDASPRRDYYSIRLHRDGGFVASLVPWSQELQFLAVYGKHDPDSLWSYEIPPGAKEVHCG